MRSRLQKLEQPLEDDAELNDAIEAELQRILGPLLQPGDAPPGCPRHLGAAGRLLATSELWGK